MNPAQRSFHVARALLDCVCLALDTTSAGCPNRRCVVPGPEPDFINCCGGVNGGQLTVNIENLHTSEVFPAPSTVTDKCAPPYEVLTLVVTALRCVPIGDADRPPSCEQLEAATATILIDQYVVREAVRCCLEDTTSFETVAGFNYRWAIGEQPTIGPEGGCAGSMLRVLIGLMECHDCSVVGL